MKRVIYALIFIMLLVPFASAEMNINVRTYSDHLVSISVLDPGYVYSLLDSYHLTSNKSGEVTATYTGTKDEVKLLIKISKDGDQVAFEKFDGDSFDTSEDLYLFITPDVTNLDYRELDAAEATEEAVVEEIVAEEVVEEEATEEEVVIEETEAEEVEGERENVLTGFVSGVKNFFSGSIYIILIVVVALGALLFAIRRFNMRGGVASTIKGIVHSQSSGNSSHEERIQRAEDKLREAQEEVEHLKRHSKIAAAEAKLEADRKALEKMKSGSK